MPPGTGAAGGGVPGTAAPLGPWGYPYGVPLCPGGGGDTGAPPGAPGAFDAPRAPGTPDAPDAPGSSTAGANVVRGSWLPPDISAVLASGGVSSPDSLNGGANTVAGSGTERSSPTSALVSVPAHGVAPAGTPAAPASAGTAPLAPASGHPAPPPGATGDDPAGTPACVSGSAPPPDAPSPDEPAAAPAAPAPLRRSGMPNLSAASCNHSGGLSRNDV